jgi:uncharacterized damage-inducible protein DinB
VAERSSLPEAWLRGPVAGVTEELHPVAHTLVGVSEEMHRLLSGLEHDALWAPVAGGWSIGQHVRHLAASTLRLVAYAEGRALTAGERAAALAEGEPPATLYSAGQLLAELDTAFQTTHGALQAHSAHPEALGDFRGVGRARLPSTVRGLLFHAAEHAQRHAGQVAILVRVMRGGAS